MVFGQERGRFLEGDSSIAMPHILSRTLDDQSPLRLHSFAWHLGIRPLHMPQAPQTLPLFLTLDECCVLSTRYFSAIHPLFSFLDEKSYWSRLKTQWSSLQSQGDFAAVVAGVAALGSYFSPTPHPQEADIKQYCFSVLDYHLSSQVTPVKLDTVSGWILRTLYTRMTTRPAIASLAAHTTMHMVDILSLHKEITNDSMSVSRLRPQLTADEIFIRRRHYWVAACLNRLLGADFGVTPVELSGADCSAVLSSPAEPVLLVQHLVSLCQILRSTKGDYDEDSMKCAFARLGEVPPDSETVSVFKADICLCLLRRVLSRSKRLTPIVADQVVSILQQALDAIPGLVKEQCPWWNILGVPFQTICIGLYVDTKEFLQLIVAAMGVLRTVVRAYESHLAKEALSTAERLVTLSKSQTATKLELKNDVLRQMEPNGDSEPDFLSQQYMPEAWPQDIDFNLFDMVNSIGF